MSVAVSAPPRTPARAIGARQRTEILTRMNKAHGQLAGITSMYADDRYCIDVLDQLSTVNAALDAVAVLVLTDHINGCVRAAIESGDLDDPVAELAAAVRRFVRSR